MDPNQILAYILIAALVVLVFLIRKDAKESVNALGDILHRQQEDSNKREEETWRRANVEIEARTNQLQEVHKVLLKAKTPRVQMPPVVQPDLPFMPPNNQPHSRMRKKDSATMG